MWGTTGLHDAFIDKMSNYQIISGAVWFTDEILLQHDQANSSVCVRKWVWLLLQAFQISWQLWEYLAEGGLHTNRRQLSPCAKTTSWKIKQTSMGTIQKETECVCNANIHSEAREIIRAAANLLALNWSEESQNRGFIEFTEKLKATMRQQVSVIFVWLLWWQTKCLWAKVRLWANRRMSGEAAASSQVHWNANTAITLSGG